MRSSHHFGGLVVFPIYHEPFSWPEKGPLIRVSESTEAVITENFINTGPSECCGTGSQSTAVWTHTVTSALGLHGLVWFLSYATVSD